ncbi:MAG: Hint domain-containing protein [Paracoccaceae bacterium]
MDRTTTALRAAGHVDDSMSGLGPGSMVMTTDGELPVEWLAAGDRVITRDHGAQPLRGLVRQRNSAGDGAPLLPDPVTLGPRSDHTDTKPWDRLRLAPGHRVLVMNYALQLNFGLDEALARPCDLTRRRIARPDPELGQLTYHHLILARHELILVGGIWVESTCPDIADSLGAALPKDSSAPLTQGNRRLARPSLTSAEAAFLRHAMPQSLSLRELLAA